MIHIIAEGKIEWHSANAVFMIGGKFPELEIFQKIMQLHLDGKEAKLILEVKK